MFISMEHIDYDRDFLDANEARPRFVLPSQKIVPDPDAFLGEIVILHDVLTGSAAEDFLMPFQYHERATLIGETTAGTSGQAYTERFDGNGLVFRVAAKRMNFPDGREFEGVGVHPDQEVEYFVEDIERGVDKAMIAALEHLTGT